MATNESAQSIEQKAEQSFHSPGVDYRGVNEALDEVYALYTKDPKKFHQIVDQMTADGKNDPTKPNVELISDKKTGEPEVLRMSQGRGDHSGASTRGLIGMDLTFGEKGDEVESKLPPLEATVQRPEQSAGKNVPTEVVDAEAKSIEAQEQDVFHNYYSDPAKSDAAMHAALSKLAGLYTLNPSEFRQVTAKMRADGLNDPTKPDNLVLTNSQGEPQALVATQGAADHSKGTPEHPDSTAQMSIAFTDEGKRMVAKLPPLEAPTAPSYENHTILPGRSG